MNESRLSLWRGCVPPWVKRWGKALLRRDGLWGHPHLRTRGVINDLYYWISDRHLDTLYPVQNYFSVFFPDLPTSTTGALSLYDSDGTKVGTRSFDLGAHALVKMRISQVLREMGVTVPGGCGTLLIDLEIPEAVLRFLNPKEPFYFWDRSYIAYLTAGGQPCFVHGVDKTTISHPGRGGHPFFYPAGKRFTWLPEIPVNIREYSRFSVVLINRSNRAAGMTLTVSDARDRSLSWVSQVRPFGVHRFELTEANTQPLHPQELRLRVDGIPSRWGRPVVFKEFANGAISVMHC